MDSSEFTGRKKTKVKLVSPETNTRNVFHWVLLFPSFDTEILGVSFLTISRRLLTYEDSLRRLSIAESFSSVRT